MLTLIIWIMSSKPKICCHFEVSLAIFAIWGVIYDLFLYIMPSLDLYFGLIEASQLTYRRARVYDWRAITQSFHLRTLLEQKRKLEPFVFIISVSKGLARIKNTHDSLN